MAVVDRDASVACGQTHAEHHEINAAAHQQINKEHHAKVAGFVELLSIIKYAMKPAVN